MKYEIPILTGLHVMAKAENFMHVDADVNASGTTIAFQSETYVPDTGSYKNWNSLSQPDSAGANKVKTLEVIHSIILNLPYSQLCRYGIYLPLLGRSTVICSDVGSILTIP